MSGWQIFGAAMLVLLFWGFVATEARTSRWLPLITDLVMGILVIAIIWVAVSLIMGVMP